MKHARVLLIAALVLSGCTGSVLTENDSSLSMKGSDTLVQVVSNLAEEFSTLHPEIELSVTGGGSSVGIAALLNESTDIANSSRDIKDQEVSDALAKGIEIQEFILGRDGLSVIVHPENPLTDLTMEAVAKMYRGEITNWSEVGGPDAEIVLYGRQSTSGTFEFFRSDVVEGDYAAEMRQMEGNQAIIDAVETDVYGIGYVGVGYVLKAQDSGDEIGVVHIAVNDGDPFVSPLDKEAVLAGTYPISRPLYQYLPGVPVAGSPEALFVEFAASEAGVAIVEDAGFYPPTRGDTEANAALLSAIQ